MSLHKEVADDILLHCDRTRSKEARYALERLFWQPLRKSGIHLRPSCVLSLDKDILLGQESQKHHLSDGLWECGLCARKFRTEHFLDKHLARRHPLYRFDNGTVCPADLCGSLIPCIPLTQDVLPPVSSVVLNASRELDASTDLEAVEKDFCHHAGLRQKRVHACSDVIHRCMLPSRQRLLTWEAELHYERFRHELCERAVQVDCVDRKDVWSTIGKPHDVLRSGSWTPFRHKIGWAVLVCVIVISLILGCLPNSAPRRPPKSASRRQRSVRLSARRTRRRTYVT